MMDKSGRLLAFDVETTGLDPSKDRIVELVFVDLDTGEVLFSSLFNPDIPVTTGAYDTHGITQEELSNAPRFHQRAPEIQELIVGKRLLGYGSYEFDTILLDRELRRAGEDGIDLESLEEIDLLRVWRRCEPRTLAGAAERFLGQSHEGAHRAEADATVLRQLYQAISDEWDLNEERMMDLTIEPQTVDRAGKLTYDEETGKVVFTFGQYKGQPIRLHKDYLEWMLNSDFPADTKQAIQRLKRDNFGYKEDC